MLVSEWLTHVNYALRGTDDDAPTVGEAEATYWISLLNRKKNELYRDVTKQWRSAFAVENIGTITASSAPSFDLPENFLAPSDTVYAISTDDQRFDFDIVQPQERNKNKQQVYIAGMNPEVLYFTKEILSTANYVGATLYAPGYYMPDDVSVATDEILLPDPFWGVMSVAAEIAGNDITYEDKEANLNTKANNLYTMMVKNNRRGTSGNARNSRYNTYQIPDTQRR